MSHIITRCLLPMVLALTICGCSDPAPPEFFGGDKSLPRDIAWISYYSEPLMGDLEGLGTVSISRIAMLTQGRRGRLEMDAGRKHGILTVVCDGTSVRANFQNPDKAPSFYSESMAVRLVLDILDADKHSRRYEGVEKVNGKRCWHFTIERPNQTSKSIWVDIERSLPRRVRHHSSPPSQSDWRDIPSDISSDDRLFGPDTSPMILNRVPEENPQD